MIKKPPKKKKKSSSWWKWLLLFVLFCFGVVAAAGHVVFHVLPKSDPDGQFTRENIMGILGGETRVYYADGKSLHGAFFDASHRIYTPYSQIPSHLVNALVAAEDSRYFQHGGFDYRGFARAVFNNIRQGAMVQGGSTLTQQTAKNLFGRSEKSLKDKYWELQNALKLEKHFSKQDILEFYLNQFYVSGTGRGVAIAAWHFFSKEPKDLSLAECAFIAGSVKGPAKYDPFAQKTEEKRKKALEAAKIRLHYVLGRMEEDGYITEEQKKTALAKPLSFRQGQFRFAVSSTMDRIEDKLQGAFYQHLFDSLKIDSWQKSQLQIITTLDADLDRSAQVALQANLSNLQLKLGGFVLPEGARPARVHQVRKGEFLYGTIDSLLQEGGRLKGVALSFGFVKGFVPPMELDTFAMRHRGDAQKILGKGLAKGKVLLVRILDTTAKKGKVPCRLETEPVIQGALYSLKDGRVIASQAGFHNTGYDRIHQAVRPFGSAWKPLLYAAALELGWRYTDSLENQWNAFSFQGKYYFPRPDHEDRAPRVSIAWAAARSENIASVWLLDHLLDRLDSTGLALVAARNRFLPMESESELQWKDRLRDSLGLILNDRAKAEIRYAFVRDAMVTELTAQGQFAKAWELRQLPYASGSEEAEKEQKKDSRNLQQLRYSFLALKEEAEKRTSMFSWFSEGDASDFIRGSLDWNLISNLAERLKSTPAMEEMNWDVLTLMHWPDLRRSLAMHEFARFANSIGIKQKLKPVQSMPLGTNDVAIKGLTVAYQTLLSGVVWKCKDGDWHEPALISEIRDSKGKKIFVNQCDSLRVLDTSTTKQMAIVLRETFESGTASSAIAKMRLLSPADSSTGLAIPVVGKTGTTNDYKNVAFLGALPSWDSTVNSFRSDYPLTIGSYVGFDNNKSMQAKGIRVAGASGALPQWSEFAEAVFRKRKDATKVDFLDLDALARGMVPWWLPGRVGDLLVDPASGLENEDASRNQVLLPLLDFYHEAIPAF